MATPLLGWISPQDRTQEQHDAHAAALAKMPKFALPYTDPGPVKVMLTDFWKRPDVVADVGFAFTGYHQLTGSCFPAGTPVRMADGSEKNIEDIVPGDNVLTHKGRARIVAQRMQRSYTGEMYRIDVTGGLSVEMTADHQVAVVDAQEAIAWKRADEIHIGQKVLLLRQSERTQKVKCIATRPVEMLPVFDFEVEEDHSFIARGLTVHNCVGASTGNAIATLAAVQRCLADNPTKAFLPWWPFDYGSCRLAEGDRGQGEGAIDSVMGQTLVKQGTFDINQPGLPSFSKDDGLYLTSQIEMQWSDGARIASNWTTLAKQYPLGTCAPLSSVADIRAAIINGYPVLDGCNMYVGGGSIVGSGANAYVRGKYDGRGGHSTCVLGIFDHPNDGPLYLYSNQWPTSTYPVDPAGAGRCCVWLPESEMTKLFTMYGGDGGETMALSHLNWFPAQPNLLRWII